MKNRRLHPIFATGVAFLLLGLFSAAGFAQVTTGSITGTVTDASGELVPGATVTIRDLNKNTASTFVTDASGVFSAPFLVPGTYEVQVELEGFKKWVRSGLVLQVND